MLKRSYIIARFIIVCCLIDIMFCSTCRAGQILKAIDTIENDCFSIGKDIECYQVLYKPCDKAYVDYCKLIREKIRQSVEKQHVRHFVEGDVDLRFILNSDGSLIEFWIDNNGSVRDKNLLEITTSSLKNASPFPPFPKDIPDPKMPFDITISFKGR